MTQFRLENKSEFVDEIQLYEYDGVCKSSEFSRLEFSQIEIQCSHSCLALKFQVSSICCHTQPACDISVGGYHSVRTVWVLGASLIRFSWHLFCCLQISRADQVTMLFSDLNKDNFLQMPALVSAGWKSAASWFGLHCPWQITNLETCTLFLSV